MKLIVKDNPSSLTGAQEIYTLSPEKPIVPCMGCYQCWMRTPGCCVLYDTAQRMAPLLGQVKELYLLSRMSYGSVSPFVKNVLDRSLSYMLPFFETKDDHSHHPLRYPGRFRLHYLMYGEATEGERETLRTFAAANGKNLEADVSVRFFSDWKELEEAMREDWTD